MTQTLERAMQRLNELPEAAQDSIAEKILLEVEEAQWSALFGSPDSVAWLEEMGAQALLELERGETVMINQFTLERSATMS